MNQKNNKESASGNEKDLNANRGERQSSAPNDLPDNEHDTERLKPEETIIDLPDVFDIPGQEHITVAPLGELADTTISSDDEEGVGLFGDDEDSDDDVAYIMGTEGDVPRDERSALNDDNYMPARDEDNLRRASLDNTDFQGEKLNEGSFSDDRSGKDLDVPGTAADNRMESIGGEDEENNEYSLGGDDND